jgi:hypothetical protein
MPDVMAADRGGQEKGVRHALLCGGVPTDGADWSRGVSRGSAFSNGSNVLDSGSDRGFVEHGPCRHGFLTSRDDALEKSHAASQVQMVTDHTLLELHREKMMHARTVWTFCGASTLAGALFAAEQDVATAIHELKVSMQRKPIQWQALEAQRR